MLGTKEMVELIRNPRLVDGIDLDSRGLTDLHRGARTGDVVLIQDCLAAAVPIDSADAEGFTPLMVATRHGKRAAIATLLQAGADPYRTSSSGMTPLLLAANNPVAMLPYAAIGADLNHVGEQRGLCPLIYAARHGFDDTVQFLISVGTDLDRKDRDGMTALDHAEANGHRKIARMLQDVLNVVHKVDLSSL
jgi:ankyrin repeat protein